MKTRRFLLGLNLLIVLPLFVTGGMWAAELPVKVPAVDEGYKEIPHRGIINLLSIDTIHSCIKDGNPLGLFVDFSGIRTLLDGTVVKPKDTIFGQAYIGPYPFEADEVTYTYKRFKAETRIKNGQTTLPVSYLLRRHSNSENWKTEGQVLVRLELFLLTADRIRPLGLYDTFVRFKKSGTTFVKQTSILEGPMVNLLRSDDPSTVVISFRTDKAVTAAVVLKDDRRFSSARPSQKHEIAVTGLEPGKRYQYYVEYETIKTKGYTFRTAPKAGEGEVIFAYAGDSRASIGSETANLMGVNYDILERCANLAFRLGADFFVFGGDLVSGYTTSTEDLRTQLYGWKQAMAGFWHHRPVYACIGNHEAILKIFRKDKGKVFVLDRWPYETDSVEAVFADELVHPQNGPEVSDPRRPTYKENVYSFQYGPVKFIAFNNNYWLGKEYGNHTSPVETGGSPEGYVMEDQLQWIQKELEAGEKDPTVKYIILFAQEPVFPNGGHIQDTMWYNGNNNVKAYTYDAASGQMMAEKEGIIEVRNRLVTMVSKNKKAAAVLGSDEHSYHKVLIDKNVPVGVPGPDDPDGSNRVCQKGGTCSPLKDLKYPTWYLVSGDAGAPYYSEGPTPWNTYWKQYTGTYPDHTSMRGCYYYSSQENFFVFKVNKEGLSLTVYNPYGEIIDTIEDLMAVKK
jgi:hypothetical protein